MTGDRHTVTQAHVTPTNTPSHKSYGQVQHQWGSDPSLSHSRRGPSMMFSHQKSSLSDHKYSLALLRFGSLIFSQRTPKSQDSLWRLYPLSERRGEGKKKKKPSLEGLVIVKRGCGDIILLGWGGCVPFQVIKPHPHLELEAQRSLPGHI